jgi:hypothetical protein
MSMLYFRKTVEVGPRAAVALWMGVTLVSLASLLERRRSRLEWFRLATVPVVAAFAWYAVDLPVLHGAALGSVWSAASAVVLARARRQLERADELGLDRSGAAT